MGLQNCPGWPPQTSVPRVLQLAVASDGGSMRPQGLGAGSPSGKRNQLPQVRCALGDGFLGWELSLPLVCCCLSSIEFPQHSILDCPCLVVPMSLPSRLGAQGAQNPVLFPASSFSSEAWFKVDARGVISSQPHVHKRL